MNRTRRVLKSLNCDGLMGLGLLLACLGLLLPAAFGPTLQAAWRYERAGIAAGEFWRLLGAHFVHLDVEHAALNAMGLVLLWALFAGVQSLGEWLLVIAVSIACIDAGFWFLQPQLQWYVGASGVLHGVMAAGTLRLLRDRDPIAAVAASVFVAKLAWEQTQGPLPFETRSPVIVSAHLYGALGGLLAGALLWARHVAIMRAQQDRVEHG